MKVSITTVQRWDREGTLKSHRTPTNRRYYTESQINDFLNLKDNPNDTNP